jgi:hypothetical protein
MWQEARRAYAALRSEEIAAQEKAPKSRRQSEVFYSKPFRLKDLFVKRHENQYGQHVEENGRVVVKDRHRELFADEVSENANAGQADNVCHDRNRDGTGGKKQLLEKCGLRHIGESRSEGGQGNE